MKLKLKNPQPAPEGVPEAPANGASQATPTSASAPKLALKFKAVNPSSAEPAAAPPADAPKQKRKYTKKPKVDENGQPLPGAKPGPKPKKRALEDGEEGAPAKRKPKPTIKSLEMIQDSDEDDAAPEAIVEVPKPRPQPNRTQSVKLSFKPKGASSGRPSSNLPIIKVKGAGKPPPRPPGVGYDSEAEEAEIDPAIESQFILRMQAGPDCDLLRKAIEEKTIGKSVNQGGPGVHFRFFDREGRRAIVTVQGRMYAASMVELPCVIESMKSWNKKDWVKAADVCQMLLVLGRVNNEEEAKKVTRPKEVEPDSHRFPHGLTPPMQWVRKRRFRPRKSYLDVERIETSTEALLQEDEAAEDVKFELVDSDQEDTGSEEPSADEDAQGEDEEMIEAPDYAVQTPEEGIEMSDILDMFHADEMDNEVQGESSNLEDLFDGESATIQVSGSAAAAQHLISGGHAEVIVEPESAASTPAAATSPDNDDDDDDEDEDEDDPEAAARQENIDSTNKEIRELENGLQELTAKLDVTTNVLLKKRLQGRIDQMERDLTVKRSQIGETED